MVPLILFIVLLIIALYFLSRQQLLPKPTGSPTTSSYPKKQLPVRKSRKED